MTVFCHLCYSIFGPMELNSKYDPSLIEEKWYKHWEKSGYFRSEPDEREPFTILIPPPNVTGVLHMGHMLNVTIQDILIRKARLDGKNACWVPGTDHASIATEAKVVRKLREKGIKKSDLSREEFLKHAWEWTDEYGGIILQQLRKLGASCDWDRTAFTMDEVRYQSVIKVFVDLHKKGKLYRGKRMVNWDSEAQTVLSNEEVLYKEESAKLYHVRYDIAGTDGETITIATTRPETILGDTAVAVHPEDPRYTGMKGKKAIVPLLDREIPIIRDAYVDMEFGTGALKVTPAHDPNDYELGKKHDLQIIDMLNDDGTVSEAGILFVREDRFKARKLIVKQLEESGHLVEIEDLVHKVGRSERTNSVVEPKLSLQWYVDMKSLAEPALKNVMDDTIKFFPPKYKNTYAHWMENIRDWCISRQLWWGQRIPAWYHGEEVFVAETESEVLALAKAKLGEHITLNDLKQDEDVLDTWFSSWLWPISVFNGFEDRTELDYYYPTSVLVTGWDIIFLWVARMVMCGYEWEGKLPYKDVYFTGMVRDKQRRKMSKSLGNSPDALKLIEQFGADGVRFGMLSCSPAGGDLLFDESLVDNGRKFSNKIWNAVGYVRGTEVDASLPTPEANLLAIAWIKVLRDKTLQKVEKSFDEYRLSEALMTLYSFIWTDVFSWYLEIIKPEYQQPMDKGSYDATIQLYEEISIMLHPFMPFITEEIWHLLRDREAGDDLIVAKYPKAAAELDTALLTDVELVRDIISSVRDIKNKNQLSPKTTLPISAINNNEIKACFDRSGAQDIIKKLAFVEKIDVVQSDVNLEGISFICGKTKLFAHLDIEIDVEEEYKKVAEELQRQNGFVAGVEKKLSNERFVTNAPEKVVAMEKKKLSDGQARIKALQERLDQLGQ